MRFVFTVILLHIFALSFGQMKISGTLLDVSKINTVFNAEVISTGGSKTVTDSFGRYKIIVLYEDSIYFVYNNKPTQKFPVASIPKPTAFDVSLRIPVESEYKVLKEVLVISNSYQQDSAENRRRYEDKFDYRKPGVSTSITPDGGVGADVNELINIFRFRRNRQLKNFRAHLEEMEQDRYINFRFSKRTVARITSLEGPSLDTFLVWYRPSYELTARSNEIEFNKYVLNSYYQYSHLQKVEGKKEGE